MKKNYLFILIFSNILCAQEIGKKSEDKAKPLEINETIVVYDENSSEIPDELPLMVIENIPQFTGCENIERREQLKCFQTKMNDHVIQNFNYPKKARRLNIQGRVSVMFVIDKDGNVKNIETRAPKGCELIENEAHRIISLLPKMKPGTQRGKAVNVRYVIPINFKLQ